MCAICSSTDGSAGMIGKISVCSKCWNTYAVRGQEKALLVAMDTAIENDERLIAARKEVTRLTNHIEKLERFLIFNDLTDEFNDWSVRRG